MNEHKTEAEAVAKIAIEGISVPQTMNVTDPETGTSIVLTVVPATMTALDMTAELDKRLPFPRRRAGTVEVQSIDSFLALVNRHKSDATVVYCSDHSTSPRLTAVMDDHMPESTGIAGHRQHRVVYAPELSEQWTAWAEHDSNSMSMTAFAEFLDERALEMIDPAQPMPASTRAILDALGVKAASPSVIRGLARSLTIHESSKVVETRNLQSGEAQIAFESTHSDADGKPLTVPGAFLVGFQIYKGGPGYLFVARLRYRKVGPAIMWSYTLAQTDAAKREVMAEMVKRIRTDTACLVVEGTP